MKKLIFRVIAYVLDLALVSALIYGFSLISFFNPNRDKVNDEYNVYYYKLERYNALSDSLDGYLEDNKISEDEYKEIVIKYEDYSVCFKDLVIKEEITDDDKTNLNSNISKEYSSLINDSAYKINKLNLPQIIISLVIYVLYFGLLQYLLNGQTVFKRLFRIRVVNKNDKNKKVSLISFIVRALLVSEILISLVDIILLFVLGKNGYVTSSYWISQFKYVYEMAFLVCMIIRDDQKSIDDILLGTRVIRFDKKGNEIVEKIFNDIDDDNKEK